MHDASPTRRAREQFTAFTSTDTAVPRRGVLKLKFADRALEEEFRQSHRDSQRLWLRMSVVVALCTTIGFAAIDRWVLTGPPIAHYGVVRFGFQLPLVVIMIVLTAQRFYYRWYQPAIQIAAPLYGLGLIVLATFASQEQLPLVATRLLLSTFFFYFMLGLNLHAALRSNLIVMTAYCTVAALGHIQPQLAIYELFVLFSANLIGAAGSYALEQANRTAFLDRRRLAEVAMHDGLTGLLNRAALDSQLQTLWKQAERDKLNVSVILIDIDHFKAYNDYYGHQAGDQCLRDVANAVRKAVGGRPLDMVARYGGEEMIAVLFSASTEHAHKTAAAVLDAISTLRIPHEASVTQPYVTASIGTTTLQPGEDNSHELAIQLADRALYSAKSRGRNAWVYQNPADKLDDSTTVTGIQARICFP